MEIVVTFRLRVDGTWEVHEIATPAEVTEAQQEGLYQAAAQMEQRIRNVLSTKEAA